MKTIQAGLIVSLLILFSSARAEVTPESIVDIFNRLDKLESQNRELRGSNDELKHELKQFKQSQKQGFLNIDEQIDELSKSIGAKKPASPKPVAKTEPHKKDVAEVKKPTPKADFKAEEKPTASPEPKTQKTNDPASSTKVANKKIRQATTYEKDTYKAAFNKIKVSPTAATTAFKEYIKMQPSSPLAANAQYWIGEIMYSHNNYKGAVQEFIKVLQDYKYSEKAPDAAIKLGYSFYALKKWDLARRTFEDVLRYFPENKNAVNLANKRLEKMKAIGK